MKMTDIAFYAAQSIQGEVRIPGVALVFPNRVEAEEAFDVATYSVTEGRLPPSNLEFRSSADGWCLIFQASGYLKSLEIELCGISDEEIVQLRLLFSRVLYLFIIFGYYGSSGELDLLDTSEHALFKQSITINGDLVYGEKVDAVDWIHVLDETAHIVLGTFAKPTN